MGKKRISNFNPIATAQFKNIDIEFSAGNKYAFTFNSYLKNDIEDYFNNGDGVTYIITNDNDIVAYFVISSSSIPYNYKIDDIEEIWSIAAVEIKMFAVDEKYQDVFFKYEEYDMPISAWCLEYIIDFIGKTIGCKAIYLHSIPEAEDFYKKNNFQLFNKSMIEVHSIDDDLTQLWMPIQEIDFGDE